MTDRQPRRPTVFPHSQVRGIVLAMTTPTKRHPFRAGLLVLAVCLAALLASGALYGETHWVLLGGLNLIIVLVAAGGLLWMVVAGIAISTGVVVGKRRR
jgi:hypothetical protein